MVFYEKEDKLLPAIVLEKMDGTLSSKLSEVGKLTLDAKRLLCLEVTEGTTNRVFLSDTVQQSVLHIRLGSSIGT